MRLVKIVISVLCVCWLANAYCQTNLVFKGYVYDESGQPIKGAHVVEGYSLSATTTNSQGYFILHFPDSENATIKISHIAYENIVLAETEIIRLLERNEPFLKFEMKDKVNVLDAFELVFDKVDTVFGSEQISVGDYQFYDENMVFLVYEKRQEKESQILYVNGDSEPLDQEVIPAKALYLHKDYMGNIYVVCEEHVFRLFLGTDRMVMKEMNYEYFHDYIKPCVALSQQALYFNDYMDEYPAFNYYSVSLKDSIVAPLKKVENEFLMGLFRAEYKYMKPRKRLEAFRAEVETGIDKEIIAGFMTGFGRNSPYYTPLYAPLFLKEDTVLVFDHSSEQIYRYCNVNTLVDSVKINYTIPENKRLKNEKLIQDEVSGIVYLLERYQGYASLKRIDERTGHTEEEHTLKQRYPEQIRIKDGVVYYIYRPFESLQKKFLYSERLY